MNNLISYNEAKIRWYKKGKFFEEEFDDKSEKDLIVILYGGSFYIVLKNEEFDDIIENYKRLEKCTVFDTTIPDGFKQRGSYNVTIPFSLKSYEILNYLENTNWLNARIDNLPEKIKKRIWNI